MRGRRSLAGFVSRRAIVAVLLSLLVPLFPRVLAEPQATAPNIVLIITDDQRWDTLWAMPHVQADLVAHGVSFANAFVVDSLCCPSRASFLTGQYSHSTNVYKNEGPEGGFASFNDDSTVATWLHDAGYHTALIGKYLNGYRNPQVIPPGWDRWFTLLQKTRGAEVGYYYNYSISDQGVGVAYGSAEADYSTDVFAGQADTFIRTTDPAQPLFLYFAPAAPHTPATAPVRYANEFSDLLPYRPPNYNEDDVSDKPAYISTLKRASLSKQATIDAFRINQYRTLLAVDDAVNTILTALSDTGRVDNTMIVFASDNGLTWAEHRWQEGKIVPYEESIRIPLVIRYDPLTSTPWTDIHLVANIDIASTFAGLAGTSGPGIEGLSLMPLVENTFLDWRDGFLIEHEQGRDKAPSFCAVRTVQFEFTAYNTGEQELYDLAMDPYQLTNVVSDPAYENTLAALRALDQQLCFPTPPGFAFPYDVIPPSTPGGLSGVAPSSSEVDLGWLSSTDNVAVTGYTIYRDGQLLATVDSATLAYADLTVSPQTTYTYTVDAFDLAGNHSPPSEAIQVTVP
jgi:arylsulfatase A-like enzyme